LTIGTTSYCQPRGKEHTTGAPGSSMVPVTVSGALSIIAPAVEQFFAARPGTRKTPLAVNICH
jgi:hypothetical protein